MPRTFSAAVAPLLIGALLSMVAVSDGVAQTPWPTERWPGTTPEVVGLSSATLDSIDAEIRAGEYGYVDRFLVIRNGQLAYDRRYHNDYDHIYGDSARIGTLFLNHHRAGPYNYFNPWWHPYYRRGDLHTLQSVTKTITSIVIGAAVNRDEFPALDTPVLSFFDSGTVANVDDRKRRMTVRHLLTMTAGLDWNEDETVDHLESSYDWVRFTIDRPMADEPGTRFNYNSGASQLLSHIFREAIGSDIEEYAARHLFTPLGITDWFWKRTPAGLPDTEGGLYLTSEDLAKLWFLFLRDGFWDGQEVVSPEWVRASVAPAIAVDDPSRPSGVHYGWKWWLHPNPTDSTRFMWLGSGFGGQFPIAIPEQDLIVVINQWNILPSGPWLIPEPIVARILRGLTDPRRSYLIPSAAPDVPDTVHVAPPTGERQADRASILAALEQVQPGDVIQFGPGTYLVGELIPIETPQLTMLGHANGTTLRGCEPDTNKQLERDRQAARDDLQARLLIMRRCGVFEMTGGHGTVRGLTFEHTWMGLALGAASSIEDRMTEGGYLVENNVFRNSGNGVRPAYLSSAPTVIRGNRFMNVFHAVSGAGAGIHVVDNDISVPEPDPIALPDGPGFAIGIDDGAEGCVIEGNRIEGHRAGIVLFGVPGRPTRRNVIRDNTITGTVFPLRLWADQDDADPIQIEDNLIERNRIMGGVVGIALNRASGNRILDNTISGITVRDPSPGEANGSGIWLSPGSDENEIVGNTFDAIAGYAVVLEGAGNTVERRSAIDVVRDLGPDNQVTAAAPSTGPDTTRFTIIINGHRQGERRMWQEFPDTWHYEHDGDAFHFPRTERMVVDADGLPVAMEIDGQRIVWDRWIERYERRDGHARWTAHTQSALGPRWSRTLGDGEAESPGPVYYAALHPVHDLGVLARLLLQREDRTLPLLPAGTARLEPLGERRVEVHDRRRRIHLYAVHGLDLKPAYVWLDEDGATFADEWSVLAGWEPAFAELRAASDEALAEHHRDLARTLVPPARERPLVIRGARLFDPHTGAIEPGTTIVIEDNRITAVGADGTLALPPDAEVLDAAGRTVLPGLWDMHAHHGFPGPHFELIAPLSLAGGITTARDVGMPIEPMLSLRRRIRAGEAVGPRILMAGWVGGAGGRPTGTLVGNAAEARAAVDRFVELGYVQIKIYSDLAHELVPVVIERAKQHGLRLSGEVPTGMTARQAVEHGYDEIQHIDGLLWPLAGSAVTELFAQRTPARLQAVNEALAELTPESKNVQELIRLIASEGVAVDPTLTVFAVEGMEPQPWVARVADRFSPQAQRRILDRHLFGYWPLTPLWGEIRANMTALVGALHEAGVPILPGSDTDMAGFDLYQELQLYVEAGISAPEVLTLATLGAARVMGMDDELGSIEPGKLADLILVDGDPTRDISHIRRVVTVIKDGRVYDPAAIYRALGVKPCCEE